MLSLLEWADSEYLGGIIPKSFWRYARHKPSLRISRMPSSGIVVWEQLLSTMLEDDVAWVCYRSLRSKLVASMLELKKG